MERVRKKSCEFFKNIHGAGNGKGVFLNQSVGAAAFKLPHLSRQGKYRPSLFFREPRRDQRAALLTALYDEGRLGKSADDAVAYRKMSAYGRREGWIFGEQQTLRRDLLHEGAVFGRIARSMPQPSTATVEPPASRAAR